MNSQRAGSRAMILGVAVLLAGCGSTAPASNETATASASAVPAVIASPTPAPHPSASDAVASAGGTESPVVAWTDQPFEPLAGAVVADGDRFVVVQAGTDDRAAWTSSDGRTWERHPVPAPSTAHCDAAEPICLERSAELGPMTRLHDTLYSFGATGFVNDYIRSIGWRWTDGQGWQVIESESPVYGGGFFKAVAASDAAIFVVKHSGYPLTEQHWLWNAETGWVGVGETIDYDNAIEYRSVAWRDGQFVAVGSLWDASEDAPYWDWEETPAAWSSVDGASWTQVPAPGDATALCSVVSTPDFFFAIGLDSSGAVGTWRSEDGHTWTPGVLPSAPRMEGLRGEAMVEHLCATVTGSVLALPGRYLALTSANSQTLTWTSNDGVSWFEDATLDVQTGRHSVAAIDGTLVAFGWQGQADDEAQVLFVGTTSAPPE